MRVVKENPNKREVSPAAKKKIIRINNTYISPKEKKNRVLKVPSHNT